MSSSAPAHVSSPRLLTTLDQSRLAAPDWIDISNKLIPSIHLHTAKQTWKLRYHYLDHVGHPELFPPNTHGFLYYHRPPSVPATAGEIRFRVTPTPDPALFAAGHDLLNPHHLPWTLPVLSLARYPGYEDLRKQLVRDGLVSPQLWDEKPYILKSAPVIHSRGQPFYCDFSRHKLVTWIAGPEGVRRAIVHDFLRDSRTPRMVPYEGAAQLCFERRLSTSGEPQLVIRVLRFVREPTCDIDGYDYHVPIPREGELLCRPSHVSVRAKGKLWTTIAFTARRIKRAADLSPLSVLLDEP